MVKLLFTCSSVIVGCRKLAIETREVTVSIAVETLRNDDRQVQWRLCICHQTI